MPKILPFGGNENMHHAGDKAKPEEHVPGEIVRLTDPRARESRVRIAERNRFADMLAAIGPYRPSADRTLVEGYKRAIRSATDEELMGRVMHTSIADWTKPGSMERFIAIAEIAEERSKSRSPGKESAPGGAAGETEARRRKLEDMLSFLDGIAPHLSVEEIERERKRSWRYVSSAYLLEALDASTTDQWSFNPLRYLALAAELKERKLS